ncbi:hypothetical protein P1X14_05495 [Sphingomonas sp. AOB5]|uniref:hypothetical protein n=1 Tax=Sphingomonas sp. AOB5 TaxID=3034017 RepID=UPI0023F9AFA8|nr:hypothetical protein [Sphingomonas sp. AOB5]MDF7774694.1 hypothetical protein [Sphingomonas sp. AOB5]
MARKRHPILRNALLVLGLFLIALTPIVGPIPGPGGIVVFGAGLVLVLQNAGWARKLFARGKRRWPRAGHYCDLALRRPSFRRRQARDKEQRAAATAAFGATPR